MNEQLRIEPGNVFDDFDPLPGPQDAMRRRIVAAARVPETVCVPPLIEEARLEPAVAARVAALAASLVAGLRGRARNNGVEGLIHEYSLSSTEGIALMCLAEALLRIPDPQTRDALIRDKIVPGDWRSHLGRDRSPFVNAATWGLLVTGRLTGAEGHDGLGAALTRVVARWGEPVLRKAVHLAIGMMSTHFVHGETIEQALANSRAPEARGYLYSYDMLGEAAMTAADAARYRASYEHAIHAIGRASGQRGVADGPGISIKLSALHPRYSRAQRGRVMAELLPQVAHLAGIARGYGIGLNVDAEEADRLDLSLDIIEALAVDPALAGWDGLGFVVQAYGKRAPLVIDHLIALGRRSGRRLMVRLVKGAYWDFEIKRAQADGMADFPVYTRKVHTDVAYIACARRLLGALDAVFPQFATHNAQTLATVHELAGPDFAPGDWEFQCLHGMGETLYDSVIGPNGLDRPCRIYAPVGTHETLMAYLVRRLLENGANSSFVNRVQDPRLAVADLTADPAALAAALVPPGAPHPGIALPRALFGASRRNSGGLDLTDENTLGTLAATLRAEAGRDYSAAPTGAPGNEPVRAILNPADGRDRVGEVRDANAAEIAAALASAASAAPGWAATPVEERSACLERAADLLEQRMPSLLGLIVREAGKSAANAVGEVREAVDFLRYYAAQARAGLHSDTEPLGPVVCISPWNFPLAIFTGQIAAALAAGNTVLAKPAEETPLIAAVAVAILRESGIPPQALHLVPGGGETGAALVGDAAVQGVMFTGSTDVARLIAGQLAQRLSPRGQPIPLIAETGGQNAMIVDSSALAEQVVADVIASAFDSAGQRCSALRLLCLQDDIAERTLAMLRGAMDELRVGDPARLASDVGPVISAEARDTITAHIAALRAGGHRVHQAPLAPEAGHGTFVAPTLIEIDDIAQVQREVFGPVLHVVRFRRDGLAALIDAINATGFGLTGGLHTRLDASVDLVRARLDVGNLYVNRNVIGAVVGVQPFGGRGLSGTGPKAGGPLYLPRLLSRRPQPVDGPRTPIPPLAALHDWLVAQGHDAAAARCDLFARTTRLGVETELPGPVGERNLYSLHPRGRVLLLPETATGLLVQLAAALATGNRAAVCGAPAVTGVLDGLPPEVTEEVERADAIAEAVPFAAVLVEGGRERVGAVLRGIAALPGPLAVVQAASAEGLLCGTGDYCLDWLMEERSTSINTAAAGGNASLMAIGGG